MLQLMPIETCLVLLTDSIVRLSQADGDVHTTLVDESYLLTRPIGNRVSRLRTFHTRRCGCPRDALPGIGQLL